MPPTFINHDEARPHLKGIQNALDEARETATKTITQSGVRPDLAQHITQLRQKTLQVIEHFGRDVNTVTQYNESTADIAEQAEHNIANVEFGQPAGTNAAAEALVNDVLTNDTLTDEQQVEIMQGALFKMGIPPETPTWQVTPELVHYDAPPTAASGFGAIPGGINSAFSGGNFPPVQTSDEVYGEDAELEGDFDPYYATQADFEIRPGDHEYMVQQTMALMDSGDTDYSGSEYIPTSGVVSFDGVSDDVAEEINARQGPYLQARVGITPYAWGGGHGPHPGDTQGISDGGGYADACGDYNKIGLDCSGFSRDYLFNIFGTDIGATTSQNQYYMGYEVSPAEARPGDLFFPASAGVPPTHVTVCIGNGMIAEAPGSGMTIRVRPMPAGTVKRVVDY